LRRNLWSSNSQDVDEEALQDSKNILQVRPSATNPFCLTPKADTQSSSSYASPVVSPNSISSSTMMMVMSTPRKKVKTASGVGPVPMSMSIHAREKGVVGKSMLLESPPLSNESATPDRSLVSRRRAMKVASPCRSNGKVNNGLARGSLFDDISPTDVSYSFHDETQKNITPPLMHQHQQQRQYDELHQMNTVASSASNKPNTLPLKPPESVRKKNKRLMRSPLPAVYENKYVNKSRFVTDFDLCSTVGSGAFGTVYKCTSRLDGCMYAIKAIKCVCRSKANRDRMLKEVYALAALSDLPDSSTIHIVRYHQAWMEEDRLYIQTELCSSNLLEELRSNHGIRFNEDRLFKLLREILLALKLVHQNGMVHLDIKPENIFVKNEQYKLGDFGLANQTTTKDEIEEGDSRYMSRELLADDHTDLTKSDIFSMGMTMYEICLGRNLPSDGPEWQSIRDGKLSPMPNVSIGMKRVICEMTKPNFMERPSAEFLLQTNKQLMSQDQKLLIIERNKVTEAQIAHQRLLERMQPPPAKRGLKRFNTWSIGEG